ncbi:MAG: pyruvate dehydrogenase complex dihydrolipoamide acetyltransferase [Bacteroidetes bacterium]|nr:pyruvate dehydrogenase complex dihydrolipoamide acetyltransferase [Bacteroidota bacterium]
MAELVRMPKMSDTMTEGVVAKWHKKIGDTIKSGELVAEIETDKATMEFESYQSGTLLYMGVQEGKSIPVNAVLAILGAPGEDYKALLDAEATAAPAAPKEEPKKEAIKTEAPKPTPVAQPAPANIVAKVAEPVSTSNGDNRIKASPLAKRLANEKGISIDKLKGTGDGGRVVKRDIDWYKPLQVVSTSYTGTVTKESYEEVTVSQMRKTIARRLSDSKFTSPHFYLTMDIVMDEAIKTRTTLLDIMGQKVSFNDMIIRACALALRQHPKVNSSWLGDTIRINHHIHIGVAVAVDEGLLVPVVRFADSKTLPQINAEVKDFAQRAKDKKLQPADWEGNTFTISNLGMFDIEEFTAIINPPDACILAIGAIKQQPIVKENTVVAGNVMRVTLSCDHRAVDGVVGSKFLQTLKGILENPVLLFM